MTEILQNKFLEEANKLLEEEPRLLPQPMEAADLLVAYLEQIGIEYVFGVPGGAIEPLFNALARSARRGGPRPVLARHESGAAFMADGYARETGKIGVCCATSGPGSTNLITGVACAYENEIPMLVITAQPALHLLGRGALQESSGAGFDTVAMFRLCTRFSALISHPDQMERQLTNALLSAYQPTPGPVHLSIPMDVHRSLLRRGPSYNLAHLLRPTTAVDDASVRELQGLLAEASKVAVLIGSSCGEAINLIIELVERKNGVFVVTPDAKGLISPRHPLYRGVFGFAGHRSAVAAVEDADVDLILVVGSNLSEWTSNGWSEAVLNHRLVHIDSCEAHLTRSPMARLHVRGRIRPVFERLLRTLRREGPEVVPVGEKRRFKKVTKDDPFRPLSVDAPIKPQYLMRELGWRSPPDTRFLTDTGNSTTWAIHYLGMYDHQPSAGGWMRVTMNFAPMGWAIGGAVGTALANRKIPVVCITGDGSLLMNGQEMTVAQTEKLTVLFVILNDAALGMVKHGQRLAGAEQIAFELPTVDFRLMAEAMGIPGHVIRTAEDFDNLDLDAILSHQGPTVLDVRVDKEEAPPMELRLRLMGR
ncbi:MAG TPA: thiamine pyrophosphate-binding protein [Gallionella sp.]|nr:thiamine pyrophosphate-binding protein [Gallionella sp.]